jgi:hypothetical protein
MVIGSKDNLSIIREKEEENIFLDSLILKDYNISKDSIKKIQETESGS